MKKLISMTDFVLYAHDETEDSLDYESLMFRYANFLKQPLELWMFVPCGYDGSILEDPIFNEPNNEIECHLEYAYQQAKERCLFKGFEYKKELRNSGGNYTHFLKNNEFEIYIQWGGYYISGKNENKIFTIEDLVKYNIQPTETALKQLGL